MPSEYDPAECLADIIENTERVGRHLRGMDWAAFERDETRQDAAERCLERICEAVYRLGNRAEALMPGHPWSSIRGTGNRLRHA